MLVTKPEILKKILKKEALEKDIIKKTQTNKAQKDTKNKYKNKRIDTSGSVENSSQPVSNLAKKRIKTTTMGQIAIQANDHLPFPSLVNKIAMLLPGYPQRPTIKITLNYKDFRDIFTEYSIDVRKEINKNLRLPANTQINTVFRKNYLKSDAELDTPKKKFK